MAQKPLVVANWKMNGTPSKAKVLAEGVHRAMGSPYPVEVVLAPPFTALETVARLIGKKLGLAGQNVHWEDAGAFTGEISAPMLRAAGCRYVLVGHSERRRLFHETDAQIAKKLSACLRSRLRPILCVGESLSERRQGRTRRVLASQISGALKELPEHARKSIIVAYEPVWAIGTGQNASRGQIIDAHSWLRQALVPFVGESRVRQTRVLYGGSVNPANSADLASTPGVDGALVGGASLKASSFTAIVRAFAGRDKRS